MEQTVDMAEDRALMGDAEEMDFDDFGSGGMDNLAAMADLKSQLKSSS